MVLSDTLLVECVPPSRVNGATTGVNVCFFCVAVAVALVHACCAPLAAIIAPWRAEVAVHSLWVGSLTAVLAYYAVESPSWLAATGSHRGAHAAIDAIARRNGKLPPGGTSSDKELQGSEDDVRSDMGDMLRGVFRWSSSSVSSSIQSSPVLDPFLHGVSRDTSPSPPDSPLVPTFPPVGSLSPSSGLVDAPKLPPAPKEKAMAWAEIFGPAHWLRTVLLGYTFAAIEIGYYGIAFEAGSLTDQLLLNFILICALDLPGTNDVHTPAVRLLEDPVDPPLWRCV